MVKQLDIDERKYKFGLSQVQKRVFSFIYLFTFCPVRIYKDIMDNRDHKF